MSDAAAIQPEQIVLEAEVYLGDWAYSVHSAKRTTDAKALFYFSDDDDMRPLTTHETRAGQGKKIAGKRFRMVLIAEDEAPASPAPASDKGRYGQFAKDLKLSGFLRRPEVWQAIGSDGDFRTWVTYQRSIVSRAYSEYDQLGDGRNVACHVRRAGDAGTGYKPDYSCVPMTDAEHQAQHRCGESTVYAEAMQQQGKTHLAAADEAIAERAAAWFDEQRIRCVETWAWDTLKEQIGVESMADAHPDLVFDWALGEGVENYLPESFKRGAV